MEWRKDTPESPGVMIKTVGSIHQSAYTAWLETHGSVPAHLHQWGFPAVQLDLYEPAFTSVCSGLKTETQSKPTTQVLGAQEQCLPYALHRFLENAPPQTLVGMCPDGLLH